MSTLHSGIKIRYGYAQVHHLFDVRMNLCLELGIHYIHTNNLAMQKVGTSITKEFIFCICKIKFWFQCLRHCKNELHIFGCRGIFIWKRHKFWILFFLTRVHLNLSSAKHAPWRSRYYTHSVLKKYKIICVCFFLYFRIWKN